MWQKMQKSDTSFIYQAIFMFKNFLVFELFYKNYNAFNQNKTKFFNYINLFKTIMLVLFWTKLRVIYYVNNWIYTTNHKRIAVNYFWFVILSGIVGMVLATLIRLEFAYPGVGIFAGDSLQYLSLATAHGVIMVFFMIMPLLFGAFANFLLPTQLGVHDVAFPRLNSAAFWFLPGGLLMLCQLVCVDRRYQRMNCFNIREIQSILKRKFFTDLINSHDHHNLLDKTVMGLRYKTNSINSINSNISLFYNYGIEFSPKTRNIKIFEHATLKNNGSLNENSIFLSTINYLKSSNFFNVINSIYLSIFGNFANLSNNFFFFKKTIAFFLVNFFRLYDNFFFSLDVMFRHNAHLFAILIRNLFNLGWIRRFMDLIPLYSFDFILTYLLNYVNSLLYFYPQWITFKIAISDVVFNKSYFKDSILSGTVFEFHSFLQLLGYITFRLDARTVLSFFKPLGIIYHLLLNVVLLFKDIFSFPFSLFNLNSLPNLNFTSSITSFTFTGSFPIHLNIFKKSSFSELDYSSRMVHFYFFIYFFLNLPFILFSCIKSLFNLETYILLSNKIYNFFTNWYITFVIDNNLFELLIDDTKFSLSNFFIKFLQIKFFSYLTSINQFYLNVNFNTLSSLFIFINEVLLNSPIFFFFKIFSNFILLAVSTIFGFTTNSFFLFIYNLYTFDLNRMTFANLNQYKSYYSGYFSNSDLSFLNKYSNEDSADDFRYLRFSNPVFKYDYKSGDYFPKLYKEIYTSLFTTMLDLTGGLKASPWFLSDKYAEYFDLSFRNYFNNVIKTDNSSNTPLHSWSLTRFSNTDGFYNLFYLLSDNEDLINKKWIALSSLNQKYYKMFNTSSMQQRIYSNWRQLKFTREAWRCKLLAARHQKTLFRRYVHEDGVFWSIERNAKDLLPGWAMITPFSSRTRFTAVGKTDIGLMGVLLVLNSSLISGANFLVTYRYLSTLNNRKMRDARAFFTEGVMVASWMMIAANPMLVIGIIMLLSDRHWQTSFFDYSGGGDTVLFQHMFWFFGHPEVYVIIIPTFGFTNTMISYYLKKRVSARASLLYSMYTIAFLGFFVWGHHMYMVGLAHTTRMLFSTLTVMISVPAATKIMHWCVTTVNSSFTTELPLLFTFTFIFFFVSGGISGMCVAHTGMDVLFHDTFYVIAHFHVMLAGAAMFGSFGAFYFYFPAIFGVKYSRIYAYLHYSYYLLGQLMTVIPMFWLGYAGMPRRVLDYPASLGGWHSIISAGHMMSVAGLMAFFIMIFDSLRQGRAVIRNTFGVTRYNTRLNFYLYEVARLTYVQQKGLTLFRFIKPSSIKLSGSNYFNFEPYETTLMSYTFAKK